MLYYIYQILRLCNNNVYTSAQQQCEQECEGDFSEVQLETSMSARTDNIDDISSACEGCIEHKRRYLKLKDKHRKAKNAHKKLKRRAVELEVANQVLTMVNAIFY